jgi:hypothetical protein
MAWRSLLPQLLVALLTAASILLAASAAPASSDADSAAVPPSDAFRGARHLGQHHLIPNTAADDDAEPEYPSSFSDAEAPSSLHNDEAELEDADDDRNGMRALSAAEDGTFPRHRASKALVISIVCFVVILSALFLALFICSAVQGVRDEAVTRERVHPVDAEDAATGP